MKLILLILPLFTLFSCDLNESIALENQKNDLSDLTGVWRLDSCSSPFLNRATLIFDSQNRFYLFNHSDGGSLYLHGNRAKNNLIYGSFGESHELIVIDSKHIQTKNSAGKSNFYFSKKPTEDLQTVLNELHQIDSLRTKLLGWWKVISPNNSIKLLNYNGVYKTFSLHIGDDGNADFFLENNLDSVVTYSYEVNLGSITLHNGCLYDDSYVHIDRQKRLHLSMGHSTFKDTVILEKIHLLR